MSFFVGVLVRIWCVFCVASVLHASVVVAACAACAKDQQVL